jgi:hypothetical protein
MVGNLRRSLTCGALPPAARATVCHDTTVSVYAIDVSPVRPAGPKRSALRTRQAPSRDCRSGRG